MREPEKKMILHGVIFTTLFAIWVALVACLFIEKTMLLAVLLMVLSVILALEGVNFNEYRDNYELYRSGNSHF